MTLWQKIRSTYTKYFCKFFYGWQFAKFGKNSIILRGAKINNHNRIFIGSKVYIAEYSWLAADPITGNMNCKLVIGDGTSIGRFSHIYASSKIEIGQNVLMAEKVYISDNLHGYSNITLPIIHQQIVQTNEVKIADGVWLGENVCIIGATIGKNCVVGANSVVTKNIPDYCVAVGAPAKIIKRYNFETNAWQKTNENGDFI